MKYLLIPILFFSVKSRAADSTWVYNLNLQVRTIEYLAPLCINPENDSLFSTFLGWRQKIRATKPTGTTLVLTDSIPTVELANLYNYCLSNHEGMSQALIMKSLIATARTSNTYLERLCAAAEATFVQRVIDLRTTGRKLLLGK